MLAGVLGLSLSLPCSANEYKSGFYTNFEALIDIQNANYSKKIEKLAANRSKLNDLENPEQAELDPDFISALVFHTPSRFAALGGSDRCALYDLLLANLAKGPKGEVQDFIVRYKDKKGQIKTVLTDRESFFKEIAFKQCPQVKKFQAYFNVKNVGNTLKTLSLKTPSSQKACEQVHQDFIKDPKTPYLCFMAEQVGSIENLEEISRKTPRSQYRKLQKLKSQIKTAKVYQSLLNPASLNYLESLCKNIESEKAFCDGFFKSSFWQRSAKGAISKIYMEGYCQKALNKKELSEKDYENCARELEKKPGLCRFSNDSEAALSPRPSCDEVSSQLNRSRLKADYEDCPGRVGNAAMVNIARLISHFKGEAPPKSNSCPARTSAMFAQFNENVAEGRSWKVSLCYQDKINNKEVCLPAIFGDVDNSPLSLTTVVERILRKTKGFGADQTCSLIETQDYRPELLKFKSGCFILMDIKSCYGVSCDYKLLLDQRELTHIKQKAEIDFDYFPKDFANESFSQTKLLEKNFKLKSKKILNASSLKRALEENQKGLVHGIACAEDLYPDLFTKEKFNQCQPLPFIIDGFKEKDGIYSFVIRSAYDSLHAPRLLPWSHLFSGLKSYQRLHPLNTWGLHALY